MWCGFGSPWVRLKIQEKKCRVWKSCHYHWGKNYICSMVMISVNEWIFKRWQTNKRPTYGEQKAKQLIFLQFHSLIRLRKKSCSWWVWEQRHTARQTTRNNIAHDCDTVESFKNSVCLLCLHFCTLAFGSLSVVFVAVLVCLYVCFIL